MRSFLTEIQAIDPKDGKLKTWCGPRITAPSFDLARQKARGYCKVIGELHSEIPTDQQGNIDWLSEVNYKNLN